MKRIVCLSLECPRNKFLAHLCLLYFILSIVNIFHFRHLYAATFRPTWT
jgi:hypothetical protein